MRRVELRPGARRDLLRLETFLAKMSPPAAERRMAWLQSELQALGAEPQRGRHFSRQRFELVLRYRRASYIVRYRVTDDKVTITRIFHGREDRPPR